MYVLTIKFNPTATKTYDYLLVNPKGVAINKGRPLRVVTGTGRGRTSYQELTVVDTTRMDALPSWVTAQIVLDDGNVCTTEKISAAHVTMLRPTHTHAAATTKRTANAPTNPAYATKIRPMPSTVTSYKDMPPSPGLLPEIERQQRIRQEVIAMCGRIFKND